MVWKIRLSARIHRVSNAYTDVCDSDTVVACRPTLKNKPSAISSECFELCACFVIIKCRENIIMKHKKNSMRVNQPVCFPTTFSDGAKNFQLGLYFYLYGANMLCYVMLAQGVWVFQWVKGRSLTRGFAVCRHWPFGLELSASNYS